jgi:pilus assembly protein Flp/PilA
MKRNIARIMKDESGATAIEYGLVVALVAVAAITTLQTLGTNLSGLFTGVSGKLTANTPH